MSFLLFCGMNKENVIQNIKLVRSNKNYSEDYVAGKLGISQSSYNRKENGEVDFSLTELLKLGEVLEIPPARFIDLDIAKLITNNEFNNNSGINVYNQADGYQKAVEQYEKENAYLRSQVDKLTDALVGKNL